ncbi:MAG: hypothetical protein IKV68_03615 [Oscillospiraceae bacterium]|nr:hypothetical protein [Oscillospiraceae bacterium]
MEKAAGNPAAFIVRGICPAVKRKKKETCRRKRPAKLAKENKIHFSPRRVRGEKYSSACKRASVASALQQAAKA